MSHKFNFEVVTAIVVGGIEISPDTENILAATQVEAASKGVRLRAMRDRTGTSNVVVKSVTKMLKKPPQKRRK